MQGRASKQDVKKDIVFTLCYYYSWKFPESLKLFPYEKLKKNILKRTDTAPPINIAHQSFAVICCSSLWGGHWVSKNKPHCYNL